MHRRDRRGVFAALISFWSGSGITTIDEARARPGTRTLGLCLCGAFAYAGGRMIPSAPALPPPPVRYLESLAVSCHVCSGRRLHPALLPEFQVSAGRSRQPSSWGDLETCPPVPVLKKKKQSDKIFHQVPGCSFGFGPTYPTAASSNFVFLSARQTVTDASVERAPQFGHGN